MTQHSNNPFLMPTMATTVVQDPPQAEGISTTSSPTGPPCPRHPLPAFPAELPPRPEPIHRGTFISRLFVREPARNTDIEMGAFNIQAQSQSQSQSQSRPSIRPGWQVAFLGGERMTREEHTRLIKCEIWIAACLGVIIVLSFVYIGVASEYSSQGI